MRRQLYTILFVFSSLLMLNRVEAQYQWQQLGPDNVSGITRALAFDNSANLYAGAQGGGLWRTTELGESWEKIRSYDEAGCNPNITAIDISGNLIYVATGATQFTTPYVVRRLGVQPSWDYREQKDGFVGYLDGLPGGGVYVSTDAGQTWKVENATNSEEFGTLEYQGPFTDVQKIVLSGDRVLIASREGLYYSDDQLTSVTKASGSEFFQDNLVFDIEVAANNTIFATVNSKVEPSDTDSLFISRDNGNTFEAVRSPELIFNGIRVGFVRTEVAVSPSDPNIVCMATSQSSSEVNKIFRYDIQADSWTQVGTVGPTFSPLGTSGRDAFVLKVYPDNKEEILIAGENWYNLTEENGWQLATQSFNPSNPSFVESPVYKITFHPTNPQILAVGTATNLFISLDRGKTFASRNRGYGTQPLVSVSSVKAGQTDEDGSRLYEAVTAGGKNRLLVNHLYNTELPSRNSFGTLSPIGYTKSEYSTVFPGAMIIQGTDGGLLRSLDFGLTFDQFYSIPISPQVANLEPSNVDTIINQSDGESAPGDLLDAPTPAQAVWALDESIPQDLIGNNINLEEDLQQQVESYLFFCSQQYVWLVQGPFGDVLQTRWNRLTSNLVDGTDEVFTAMTVSKDGNHTVYVASSLGNIWRIDNPTDLANFDADANVVKMNASLQTSGLTLSGNWISSLALDPRNPDRLILTFAGYGGFSQGITTSLWITDNARDSVPVFGEIRGLPSVQPIYASEWVIDPNTNESVLLLGTETGMLSVGSIEDQGFPFVPRIYLAAEESITQEIPELSTTPVTDIFVRRYSWAEEGDNIQISNDFTTFVATYGGGVWTSESFVAPRKEVSEPDDEEKISHFFSQVYPNPSLEEATLQLNLPESAEIELRIMDLNGKLYSTESLSAREGILRHKLPSAGLAEGLYLIEVSVKGKSLSEVRSLKWAKF